MKHLLIAACGLFTLLAQANNIGIQTPVAVPASLSDHIGVNEIDGRSLLTDADGITLYTFDLDSTNQTVCFDSCLTAWPPLLLDEPLTGDHGAFGSIVRPNGDIQLTVDGLPLYYFFRDTKPGDLFGEYPDWRPVPTN